MRRRRLAGALPLALVFTVACSFATGGGGGHHHGGSCTSTTFINDDFHSGSLASWTATFGVPSISNDHGNPPPAAQMINAGMANNAQFADSCGVTVSADVRRDTGFAIIKIVAAARVAQISAFDTVIVYRLCNNNGCMVNKLPVAAPDMTWHTYRFVFVRDSAISHWYRDGVLAFSLGNVFPSGNLVLVLGAFPVDSAGTGPSRGYFDNALVTGP